MARPLKTGLSYFSLDCDLCDKVEALDAKYENDGFSAWIRLLQSIYKTDDGCFRYSDVFRRTTAAKRANLSEERWNEIVLYMVEVGLFDQEAFKTRGVLTSNGIQKRIDAVSSERAAARRRAESRSSPTPPPKSKQRKVKESKVKETPHSSANNPRKTQIIEIGKFFRCSEDEKAAFIAEDGDIVFADRVAKINDHCANKGPYKDYAAAYRTFRRNAAKFDAPSGAPKQFTSAAERRHEQNMKALTEGMELAKKYDSNGNTPTTLPFFGILADVRDKTPSR